MLPVPRRSWLVAAIVGGALLAGSAASAAAVVPPPFLPAPGSPFAVGAAPEAIAAGDLDGDGRPDLVVAHETLVGSLGVLLGDGDGGFVPTVDYPTGSLLTDVAIVDLDEDGKLDVVATSRGSAAVIVRRGNGDGTLQSATPHAVGSHSGSLAVGDVNGDGNLDVVAPLRWDDTVSVLIGDGTGGFAPAVTFATGDGPNSVAIGDLNGDRKPDLVTTDYDSQTISVLFGNGAGGFAPPVSVPATGSTPNDVSVADATADGIPDIVYIGQYSQAIRVLPGDGTGSFSAPVVPELPTGGGLEAAAVGDLNGDGIPDIAFGSQGQQSLGYVLGDGTGGFHPGVRFAARSAFAIVLADLNRDGRPDLAGAGSPFGPRELHVLLNGGTPDVVPTPTNVDFDPLVPGHVGSPQTVTIRNAGSAAGGVTAVELEGPHPDAFRIAAETCSGRPLLVGTDCTVTVTFVPDAVGVRDAILRITGNDAVTTVPLRGEGAAPPVDADVPPGPGTEHPPLGPPTGSAPDLGPRTASPSAAQLRRGIVARRGPQRFDRSRRVALATVSCPAAARSGCRLTVPRRVTVRVGGQRLRATIAAPKRLKAGARATVRARVSRATAERIARARPRIAVTAKLSAGTVTGTKRVVVRLRPR